MSRKVHNPKNPGAEVLRRMYWDEGKTCMGIGSELGVHHTTVFNWLKIFNIPRRNQGKLPGKTVLYGLYVTRKMSLWQIARLCGVSDATSVRCALKKYGIPCRPRLHVGKTKCIEHGCARPVHKIRHSGNGSMYGTRCKFHRRLHRAKLGRDMTRAKKNIAPIKWVLEFEIPESVKQSKEYETRKEMEAMREGKRILQQLSGMLKQRRKKKEDS